MAKRWNDKLPLVEVMELSLDWHMPRFQLKTGKSNKKKTSLSALDNRFRFDIGGENIARVPKADKADVNFCYLLSISWAFFHVFPKPHENPDRES